MPSRVSITLDPTGRNVRRPGAGRSSSSAAKRHGRRRAQAWRRDQQQKKPKTKQEWSDYLDKHLEPLINKELENARVPDTCTCEERPEELCPAHLWILSECDLYTGTERMDDEEWRNLSKEEKAAFRERRHAFDKAINIIPKQNKNDRTERHNRDRNNNNKRRMPSRVIAQDVPKRPRGHNGDLPKNNNSNRATRMEAMLRLVDAHALLAAALSETLNKGG